MSWWTKARGAVVQAVGALAAPYTGGASLVAAQAYAARERAKASGGGALALPTFQPTSFSGVEPMSMQSQPYSLPGVMPTMGTMPRVIGPAARALGFGAGVLVARGRNIARAAAAMCVKHPQWCSTIGGVAAIAAMMESGQMPIPKKRRGRGLTPRDLRSFRRVARLIRVFAPTVRRIPHRALHVRGTGITHA